MQSIRGRECGCDLPSTYPALCDVPIFCGCILRHPRMTELTRASSLPSVPLSGHVTPADLLAQLESHARDANVPWDSDSNLEHLLHSADEQRQEAKDYLKVGNYEGAFITLSRAVHLLLEEIPIHPEYDVYPQDQWRKVYLTGQNLQEELAALQALLLEHWRRITPEDVDVVEEDEQWRRNDASSKRGIRAESVMVLKWGEQSRKKQESPRSDSAKAIRPHSPNNAIATTHPLGFVPQATLSPVPTPRLTSTSNPSENVADPSAVVPQTSPTSVRNIHFTNTIHRSRNRTSVLRLSSSSEVPPGFVPQSFGPAVYSMGSSSICGDELEGSLSEELSVSLPSVISLYRHEENNEPLNTDRPLPSALDSFTGAPALEIPAGYAGYESRSKGVELLGARNANLASGRLDFQRREYLTDNTRKLVARLSAVLQDVTQYKKLLRCRGLQAQQLLDLFQTLSDTPHLDGRFRCSLIVAMQRLSRCAELYPTCYSVSDIELVGQDPIAAGSFADVYKGNSGVRDFLKRFSSEAILWSQLSHPNLLPSYGLYRYVSRLCLVSPWMENGDIIAYLLRNPDVDRLLLVADISAGVNYLHDNDIIHGDLKGANILVNSSGRACLADFGLSAVSDSSILHWTSHSMAASKGGSIRWQAPELFDIETDEVVFNSKASDVYAWSCVCYEIFTGNVPFFEQARDSSIMLKVKAGVRPSRPPPSSPAWSSWGLSEHVWSLMQVCWSEDPTKRATMAEIIAEHASKIPVDRRPIDRGHTISPARFRYSMGGREALPSVADLEAVLQGAVMGMPDVGRSISSGSRSDPQQAPAPFSIGESVAASVNTNVQAVIDRDMLAMWSNASPGFELDSWGTYLAHIGEVTPEFHYPAGAPGAHHAVDV